MSPQAEKFFAMLRGIKNALEQKNFYITSSFTLSSRFASTNFNATAHVDIFDLFHIHQMNTERGMKQYNFAQIYSELEPRTVKEKILDLISWGIPSSKIVLSGK